MILPMQFCIQNLFLIFSCSLFKAQLISSREHKLPTTSRSKSPSGRGGASETQLGSPAATDQGGRRAPGPRPALWQTQVRPFDRRADGSTGRFAPRCLRGEHELPDESLRRTLGSGQLPVSRWQRQPLREVALLAGSPRILGSRCSHEAPGVPLCDPEV